MQEAYINICAACQWKTANSAGRDAKRLWLHLVISCGMIAVPHKLICTRDEVCIFIFGKNAGSILAYLFRVC